MDQPALTPAELQQAFALFNATSVQLTQQFETLQQQVSHLSEELAASNQALQQQLSEKDALARRVSSLLAALPAGVLELDAEGVITAANWAAEQWFGPDLPSQRWLDVAVKHLRPTLSPEEWELLDGQGQHRARLAIQTTAGANGEGQILLVTDLTGHYLLQQQLEQHKKLAAMGEMAAGLAHQLRTPLATALLYVSHLGNPQLPDAQRQKFTEKTTARLHDLEGLIADMLLFVRGSNHEQEAFDAGPVLQDALATVLPHAQARSCQLNGPATLPPIPLTGSRTALQGAVINLLENAVSFAQHTVTLEVGLQHGWLQLNISDDGPGIPPEQQSRVFEPFFTTRNEGTGLGLAIVKRVAEDHGGAVSLHSTPNQGCRFEVVLPLRA